MKRIVVVGDVVFIHAVGIFMMVGFFLYERGVVVVAGVFVMVRTRVVVTFDALLLLVDTADASALVQGKSIGQEPWLTANICLLANGGGQYFHGNGQCMCIWVEGTFYMLSIDAKW